MTTNLTIDDSSSDIIYSSNWAVQFSLDDPDVDEFFQSTYHSAQADGASANLTFIGSAIYLYGSKGPGHANYSVQFDDFIIFFSANQPETEYQQLLFGQTFNTSGTHFVSLTSRHVPSSINWLDLDYITIAVNETDSDSTVPSTSASTSTPTPTASPTISPPWLLETSSTGLATASQTSPSVPTTSGTVASSSTNRVTLVLAAVFGGLFLAALIFGLGFFIARRGKRRDDQTRHLRPDTPGVGTGAGVFTYKPPPSPSFFAGPMSPTSPDYIQSPASRTDPFRDMSSPSRQVRGHGPLIEGGRHSPHSMISLGGATVLTGASTAQLLNPHLHKSGTGDYVSMAETQTHKQSSSVPVLGTTNTQRAQSPLQTQTRSTSGQLPIYKQHRTVESESAISALKNMGSAGEEAPVVVVLPDSSAPPLASETPRNPVEGTGAQAQSESDLQHRQGQPGPLMALHAAHRSESDLTAGDQGIATGAPQRPKRPKDNLLDFLGSHIAQRLERSATAKRRRDDANSERTNFLKV